MRDACVVLRGAAWYCVVLCGAVWCCVVLRGAAWCCVLLRDGAKEKVTFTYTFESPFSMSCSIFMNIES